MSTLTAINEQVRPAVARAAVGPTDRATRAFVLAIRAEVDRYVRVSREPAPDGSDPSPERFCDELLERLFASGAVDPDAFFAWVTKSSGGPALLYVLAARHARRLGRRAEAAWHAGRAVALDQHDLYAQRLALAATPDGERQLAATEAWLADRFCPRPFEVLETRSDGSANTCCNAWMPASVGNIQAASADELWNSWKARAIRRSVLDGSFRYCSRMFCPKIAGRDLSHRDELTDAGHRAILREGATVMRRRPRRLLLSHDRSCNLACPSCRTGFILARKDEQDRLDRLAGEVLFPLMRDARRVKVTGSGDPFGSAHFRDLLKRLSTAGHDGLKLEIQTNGQLLDRRAWEELGLEGRTDSVTVSVDAARPETYERLRRGGSHERLLRNLEFVAGLRRGGRLRWFQLDAVVQVANLDELPEIVVLARDLGADRVSFQRIRNWGTFDMAEFAGHDVASSGHPRYAELRAVLRRLAAEGPGVDLGNLGALA